MSFGTDNSYEVKARMLTKRFSHLQRRSFGIIKEGDITAQQLVDNGAMQVLSFGPALIENGQVAVDSSDEVGKAMASNPRTAIGIVDDSTYVFVVSDGRTSESQGLSLKQLAEFMKIKRHYRL